MTCGFKARNAACFLVSALNIAARLTRKCCCEFKLLPRTKFDKWAINEKQPAVEAPAAREGRETLLSLSCMNCHAIRGTSAKGTFGPDLTHLMTRETLASGIMPNTTENVRTWVRNSQQLKPGSLMPSFTLSESELDKVVNYLTTLK